MLSTVGFILTATLIQISPNIVNMNHVISKGRPKILTIFLEINNQCLP